MAISIHQAEKPEETKVTPEIPPIAVSVIVPITERYDDLVDIYRTHAQLLHRMGRSFEFIFVADGGFEEEAQKLLPLVHLGDPVRVLTLPRQFGEATALMTGLKEAKGDVLLTLASYFQVLPAGIERVLSRLEEGYDLVVTRRFPRIDSWTNRLQTRGFHFLTRRLTGVDLKDLGCGLRSMRRQVARELHLYGDLHRFLPLLAFQRGFRVAEVDVPQHPADRRIRVPKLGVYLRRLLDILTLFFLFKFTKKPLRFFGLIGAGLFGVGFFISVFLTVQRILGMTALAERPLLIFAVLLMVLGVQTGSIGLLGEMIIFTHARKMKEYTIERLLK